MPAETGATLSRLLQGSFIDVVADAAWVTTAWTKLMINASVGGVCTLTRTDTSIFGSGAMTSITTSMMEEIAAVGRAEGADLPAEIPQQIAGRLRNSQTVSMSSIVRDRLAGRPTEWDARNGVVGRIGRRHAIPTPINDLITSLIRAGEPPINDPEFSNA